MTLLARSVVVQEAIVEEGDRAAFVVAWMGLDAACVRGGW
jgi:hypothetical protein